MARKLKPDETLHGPAAPIDLDRAQSELAQMKKEGVGLSISAFTMPNDSDGDPVAAVVHVSGMENTAKVLDAVNEIAKEMKNEEGK